MPTDTYTHRTYDQTWTVPAGVSSATFRLYGAGGADGAGSGNVENGAGSNGGYAEFSLSVNENETYYLYIGESPNDENGGWPDGGDGGYIQGEYDTAAGGGGGGRTEVRSSTSSSDIIAIAGGGGGGGSCRDVLSDSGGGYGGDGGGTSGGGGETIGFADGGAGGGQSCGGPTDSGGNGDTDGGDFNVSAGGGGGGGYCGGGGGEARTYQNDYCHGAGGGGASGIINRGYSTSISTGGGNSGDGLIEVEYAQAPADPQNAAQTVQGDDEIDLTWDENPNGGPVDDYDVQVSEDGGSYSTVVSTYSGTSYTYTADPAANEHRFRVRANNSDGSSGFTYSETVATDATNLAVTGTARSEISFAWDGVRDATGYEVLRAEATGSAVADYTSVATPTTSPYTGTGLEDGERYYYRVRATYPGTDSQLTTEVNASTPLPAPTLETLDKSTPREVRIGYTLNDNSTDGDIRIERSADGGTTWTESASITDLSTTEYTDTGLLDGQEYTYRLTRRTDHVETGSATASAITILPAPTDLTNPTIGEASAEYAWTATHNQGQTRVEYRRAGEGDSWTTYETVGNETESATVDGLLNGEQYEGRVVAETDDAETEDE